ncbi:intradiol ring-cleavage dioxygenase [Propionibacteriaceae bacterium Y2011]|uniref:intradiol ring-cleavage dioxygenase n=1 Tax=Microlunatus sp. Y2014 TaxID=3418488 RepID=UPI003B4BF5AD
MRVGMGAAALGLAAACTPAEGPSSGSTGNGSAGGATGGGTSADGEIPEETAGPFPGNGSNGPDALEESGIVRSDVRSSFGGSTTVAEGIPLTLELTVTDLAGGGGGFADVAVYVWQCDREGRYSLYSDGVENENYLRGVQVADANGGVSFTTIYPACYPGRWPHIHFEVYPDSDAIVDSTNAIATSQVALPEDVSDAVYATAGYEQSVQHLSELTLESDNVFGDDGGGLQLAEVTGTVDGGFHAVLTVGVDTRT